MEFPVALEHILRYEGGLVDHPKDPGGITKYGISLRAHPYLGRDGIRKLTRKQAASIYKKDYWDTMKCDQLPAGIRLIAFDCAVNQGVGYARKALQTAASVTPDGQIGPVTLHAIYTANIETLVQRFAMARFERYRRNRNWTTFRGGWMARLLHVTSVTMKG